MARQELVEHFIKYPGNLDTGAGKLLRHLSKKFFNVDKQEIYDAKKEARIILKDLKEIGEERNKVAVKEWFYQDKLNCNNKPIKTTNPFASFDKTVSGEVKYNSIADALSKDDKLCENVANQKYAYVCYGEKDVDKFIKDWETSLEIENRNLQSLKEDLVEEGKKYYQGFGYKKEEPKVIENVLFVGDLHAPFIKNGYLEHCLKIYKKYNCNKVIFAGDIIDNHALSMHETNIKAVSVEDELDAAIFQLKQWHNVFPDAFVCYGNHDTRSAKRMQSSGIPRKWMNALPEVLQTPTWKYAESFIFNDVLYCHGEGRKSKNRMDDEQISIAQGHWHSETSIIYARGLKRKTFALQIGCGIAREQYAFDYAKHYKEPHLNCAVILNNGTLPIIEWLDE